MKKRPGPTPPKKTSSHADIFESVNAFLKAHAKTVLGVILAIELLSSFFLFDLKMTIGGDDSGYILSAFDFVHDFEYPGQFQGALYSLFLSVFIGLFGVNIILLKGFSFLCMFLFFVVFYFSFKDKIPPLVLFSSMLLLSFNSHLLYYASYTCNEAFFLLLQASFFLVVNRFFLDKETASKSSLSSIVILGLVLFLLTLCKNIGLGCFIVTIFFFLLKKHCRDSLLVSVSFGVFYASFEILKRIIWPVASFQISNQGSGLLYKDFYNPSQGYEDASGMIDRIVGNSHKYLSLDFYNILGLRGTMTAVPWLTVLTYCLFLITAIILFKKNKVLLFAGIYGGVMSFITFVVVQIIWGQERLILIYVPYLVLFLLGGLYYLLKNKQLVKMQPVFFIIIVIPLVTTTVATSAAMEESRKEFKQNISKDPYYGFNYGVKNYIKMTKWASEHVPADKVILCRKPEISFAYTGRKFLGVYSVPNITYDSLFQIIKADTGYVYCAAQYKSFFTPDGTRIYNIYQDYRQYFTAFATGFTPSSVNLSVPQTVEFQFFKLPKNKVHDFIKGTAELKIPIIQDIDSLKKAHEGYTMKIYQPDILLNWLRQNNVSYVIVSNFAFSEQMKPAKKDYVLTIQKFFYPIAIKYPIFTDLHMIGDLENSSTLVQVDYDKLNYRIPSQP